MPCGHSRTNSNVEKVAERRSRTSFKRSLDHSKHKFCSKEREAPGHALRNSEQRINELIGGDTLSNCRAFGDPLKLESINLHDLHPASWYSVAWYPIYRIPDGNFRAAFLTYHSLGHFVHRSPSSKASDSLGCIVSPVVGLQTYNDKGECWFKLKDSVIQEAGYSNPSEILKERLGTLKQVANVMARASVSKGNQRSVNRHPDYEFFLSRSR